MAAQDKLKSDFRTLVKESKRVVVFTGAGVSTESGVADYRSQGGLWQRYQPITYQEFVDDPEMRKEYWRRKKEFWSTLKNAAPNPAHLAIARLEKQVPSLGVITQNIDGFHQLAGSTHVLEIHGTNREALCLDCKKIFPFGPIYERLIGGEEIPLCEECEGLLKPNTISFGQHLNPVVLGQCFDWSQSCDLMIAVGSTLVVEPAASMPRLAKETGAGLVIINREETPLDYAADLVIHQTIGEFLKDVVA